MTTPVTASTGSPTHPPACLPEAVGPMRQNGAMPDSPVAVPVDTAVLRKARGAFFTPDAITQFITDWAVRDAGDAVLEPLSRRCRVPRPSGWRVS